MPSDMEQLAQSYLDTLQENTDEAVDEAKAKAEAELQATVDILMHKGEAMTAKPDIITATSHPILKLESILKNALAYKVGDWGRDPKIKTKGGSDYFEIRYGQFRELAANDSNKIIIEDYPGDDPLRIPSGGLKKASKENGIIYSKDANFWIGPTKATLFSVFDKDTSYDNVSGNKKQTAVFTMAVSSIKLEPKEGEHEDLWKNGGKLIIEFYNKPGKGSSFPSPDFKQYVPLEVSDNQYDEAPLLLGHYVDPTKPSVDDMMSNLLGGFSYDVGNGVLNTAADTTNGFLQIAQDTAVDVQFYCCIFYEIMKNQPELLDYLAEHELDPNNLSPAKIWLLEQEQKVLTKIKPMLTGNISKLESGISQLEVASDFINALDETSTSSKIEKKILDSIVDMYLGGGEWSLATMTSALNKLEKRLEKILEEIVYYKENPMSLEDFLSEQKAWLDDVKSIAQILLVLLETKHGKVGLPALGFNMIELTTNSVQLILMTMVDVIREHLMTQSVKWVADRKKEWEEEADKQAAAQGHCFDTDGRYLTEFGDKETCETNGGIWKPGSTYYSAAVKCLPWEKVLIMLITSIFGKDGFFKSVQAFIQRIKNMMLLKQKNKAINEAWNSDDKEVEESRLVPMLKGLINMIDWLLALNADGILICNKYKNKDKSNSELDKDGTSQETTMQTGNGEGTYTTGTGVNVSGNTGSQNITNVSSGGAGNFLTSMPTGNKIDITNNDIDPIGLLVLQEDAEVQKFMMQYMGLSSEEASDAIQGSKKGECLKSMSSDDIQELQSILNKAGTDL